MNWMTYFADFFRQRSADLQAILDAAGCREGWVQGEMFLHARQLHLETNATGYKFDLHCPTPPMIAEIKICGGDYAPKMKGYIQDDVKKLADAQGVWQRFLILVVDKRHPDTSLGRWLTTCEFPHLQTQEVALSEWVVVRMWQITDGAQRSLGADSDKAADGLTGAPQS